MKETDEYFTVAEPEQTVDGIISSLNPLSCIFFTILVVITLALSVLSAAIILDI